MNTTSSQIQLNRYGLLQTRLKLLWNQFKINWRLFANTGYGPVGLAVVFLYVLMAIAHPILMATVWEKPVYDPVIGLAEIKIEDYTSPIAGEVVAIDSLVRGGVSIVNGQKLLTIKTADGGTSVVTTSTGYIINNVSVEVGDVVGVGDPLFVVSQLNPLPPSAKHLLGTDPLGRDVLSQILYSTRSELILGLLAAVVTLVVATTVGATAAYFGGWIDALLMRLADLVLMLPSIAFLIVLGVLFNLQFWSLAVVVGSLSGFGGAAIILKSQALTVKVKPYIDAAKVNGSGPLRIIFSHIVPQLLPLAFLFMMFTVTSAVFSEAVLSFFGILNISISWGLMLSVTSTQGYLLDFARWWLIFPSSAAITLFCGSFYLIGRGLDPIVNPKLRAR